MTEPSSTSARDTKIHLTGLQEDGRSLYPNRCVAVEHLPATNADHHPRSTADKDIQHVTAPVTSSPFPSNKATP